MSLCMCVCVCLCVTNGDKYFGGWSNIEWGCSRQPRNELERDSWGQMSTIKVQPLKVNKKCSTSINLCRLNQMLKMKNIQTNIAFIASVRWCYDLFIWGMAAEEKLFLCCFVRHLVTKNLHALLILSCMCYWTPNRQQNWKISFCESLILWLKKNVSSKLYCSYPNFPSFKWTLLTDVKQDSLLRLKPMHNSYCDFTQNPNWIWILLKWV